MQHIAMESLDLCRRINEFGTLRRHILFLVLGKFATNELVIMRDNIEKVGYDTTWGYECDECEYNRTKLIW